MAGRPRKPTELMLLKGAFDHNPDRRREIGPKSEDLGDYVPPTLTREEAKVWRELTRIAPKDVLTQTDRVVLEIVVRLTAKMRAGAADVKELSLLSSNLSKLGWTPADRSRISSTKKEEAINPLAFLDMKVA